MGDLFNGERGSCAGIVGLGAEVGNDLRCSRTRMDASAEVAHLSNESKAQPAYVPRRTTRAAQGFSQPSCLRTQANNERRQLDACSKLVQRGWDTRRKRRDQATHASNKVHHLGPLGVHLKARAKGGSV